MLFGTGSGQGTKNVIAGNHQGNPEKKCDDVLKKILLIINNLRSSHYKVRSNLDDWREYAAQGIRAGYS